MAFKVKTVKVNIDIDLSDVQGINENEKLIKPVKTPTVDNIMIWGNKAKALVPEGVTGSDDATKKLYDKYNGDVKKICEDMIEAIDYWYGKGITWWSEKLDADAVMGIYSFLVGELFKQKKK